MPATEENPYELDPANILEPPTKFAALARHLGPGFILSASIVGSGELIATTLLGAKAGFVCLWVVLFSCLVKVAVQLEFGKFAIYSGKTTMEGLNALPGPKFGKANWSIWTWLTIMTLKFLQVGGIVGGVVSILVLVAPLGSVGKIIWSVVTVVAVALLVRRGLYRPIERWSILMIGLFTIFTFISLVALQWTPLAISGADIAAGFTFTIPPAALIVAIGAFGITGVGGDEIMAYNYWLIEKGYASHTGPRENSEAWNRRALGWIRIMKFDAVLSMVCYTIVTALFYLLGAAVLNRKGLVPEGSELVSSLATMYTESLGPWAMWAFIIGALVVLFSTLLAALAAWTRMFSDAFGQIGWIDFHNPADRRRMIGIFAWVFPSIWAILFLIFKAPAFMVIVGGVATAFILLIVVFAAIIMRLRWLPAALKPSKLYDLTLTLSALAIAAVAVYSVWSNWDKFQSSNAPPPAAEETAPADQ